MPPENMLGPFLAIFTCGWHHWSVIGTIPGHIHMFSGWHRWSAIGTIPGHIHMFSGWHRWSAIGSIHWPYSHVFWVASLACDWDHSWPYVFTCFASWPYSHDGIVGLWLGPFLVIFTCFLGGIVGKCFGQFLVIFICFLDGIVGLRLGPFLAIFTCFLDGIVGL